MVDSSPTCRLRLFEEFFSPTRIIINHQRFDSFKKLVTWCLNTLYPSIEKEILYETLEAKALRSPSFTTVFENGLFFPHLKLEEIKTFHSLFVVLSNYPVEPKTKLEVRVVFLLFSPLNQNYFEKHLNILGLVSSLLREVSVVKKLSELKTPDDVYHYLKTLL
ncbi:MAG: PTS sugar transporter subunit IIA [Elusimicrobiales bacterium]|nr:PTS sugar transporter subunit IIA [Elusimicrobiales bacterium]